MVLLWEKSPEIRIHKISIFYFTPNLGNFKEKISFFKNFERFFALFMWDLANCTDQEGFEV